MTDVDPKFTGIVAWGWACSGMKGMALGHLKPTPENTHKFFERNTQVFPLVVKSENDALSALTDRELAEALALRIHAKLGTVALSLDGTSVDLTSDDFGICFYFDEDGALLSKNPSDAIFARGEKYPD